MQNWWTHWEQHLLHWIKMWPWVRLPSVSAPPFVFILSLFLHLTRCMSVRRYLLKLLLEAGLAFGRQWGTLGGADLLGSSGFYLCDLPRPQGCGVIVEKVYRQKHAGLSVKEKRIIDTKCWTSEELQRKLSTNQKTDDYPECLWKTKTLAHKTNHLKNNHISLRKSRPYLLLLNHIMTDTHEFLHSLHGDEVEWKPLWLDIGTFYHLWNVSCTVGPRVKLNLVPRFFLKFNARTSAVIASGQRLSSPASCYGIHRN